MSKSAVRRLAVAVALITSLATLAVAQTATTTTDPVMLRLQQETALANARAAESNAEKAATDASLAGIPTTTLGATTPGANAGLAEAGILSADQLVTASNLIAQRLVARDASNVVVLTGAQRADIAQYRLFEGRLQFVTEAYTNARHKSESLTSDITRDLHGSPEPRENGTAVASSLLDVASDLGIAARIGGLFQRDINVSGATLTPDDNLLATAIAVRLRQCRPNICTTHVYLVSDWLGGEAFTHLSQELDTLDGLRDQAQNELRIATDTSNRYKNGQTANAADRQHWNDAKGDADAVIASINAAITAHQNLVDWLAQAPANQPSTLLTVVQQMSIQTRLAQPNSMLILVHATGAQGAMTERSLWTFIGSPPFSVAATTTIVAQVIDPNDGAIQAAMIVQCDSDYTRMNRIHDSVRGRSRNNLQEPDPEISQCRPTLSTP